MSRAPSAIPASPNNKKDDKAQNNKKDEATDVDEQGKKTRFKAYVMCFFFWWCGFPHWYLGRITHAVLRMTTFGMFGGGALTDLFCIGSFVNQANGEWYQKGLGYNFLDGITYLLVSVYYESLLGFVMDETLATFIGVIVSAYICLGLGRKRFDPIGVPTTLSFRMALFWFLMISGVLNEEYVNCRYALALCQSVRPESDPPSGKSGLLGRVITFLFVLMCMLGVGFNIEVELEGGNKLSLSDVLYRFGQALKNEGFERVFDGVVTTIKGEEKIAYQTLGLDPSTATPVDAKKQWKSLVRKYHPDRAPDEPPETLAKINQAYETLNKMYKLRGGKENEDIEREVPTPSGTSFTYTTHDSTKEGRKKTRRGTRKTSPSDR